MQIESTLALSNAKVREDGEKYISSSAGSTPNVLLKAESSYTGVSVENAVTFTHY
jgi:hypothetical protein